MNAYIVLFLPCVVGVSLYKILVKENERFELLFNYLVQVFFTNLFMGVILIAKKTEITSFSLYVDNNFSFAIKYMTAVVVLSIVISVVFAVLKKYFKFEIEVTNGRKKKK